MEPREQPRGPAIAGINTDGENLSIDYSANLMNLVLFFDPVSRTSLEAVEAAQILSLRYEKMSVGFWYVMEPKFSCMYRAEIAGGTLKRLALYSNTLFDVNSLLGLNAGIRTFPGALLVDSNGFIRMQCEGDIAFREIERSIQARLAISGYRVELPGIGEVDLELAHAHSVAVIRQLGYGSGDYPSGAMVVPEANQEFSLPDLFLSNTVYPHGDWYVGRDYLEGKNGSTIYLSCGREESVYLFAGSDKGATLRVHTSIEPPNHLAIGRDLKNTDGLLDFRVSDYRPYEVISCVGDGELMVSLQVMEGSLRLYSVEFCPLNQLVAINH